MHDFTVLVSPGGFATSVSATLDILRAAAAVAPRLQLAAPTWRVVSMSGGEVGLGNGLTLRTKRLPRRARADASTWIVPGLGTETVKGLHARLAQPDARAASEAIAAHLARGGAVAAACSAVFLLQGAGVLADRRVTTSWWLAPALQKLEPRCAVDAGRMVCVDGPLATAGAAFAQTDLMLHLLRARFGAPLADMVRRVLLIDAREAQAPYALPGVLASGSALVTRLTERIESALPRPPSVRELAGEFAMSERTLARHVRAATGMGTLALLQTVRLNRARMLIETSRMNVEQVAAEVGYGDATALRRLMRKMAGANPSRFRAQLAR
jgi:transcriptional regulator GlxA family with amidase domain